MTARARQEGDVLVVTLDNPPVNSLNQPLRESLLDCLKQAETEPHIQAVVLVGAGSMFCGGADIRALDTPAYWAYPRTVDLAAFIDEMSKPVVAAVSGLAMGGGLELAMGCHWRVVAADARLALPEVRLGLLPGGGGTFRLPRLIGVEAATEMMLTGQSVDGRRAREIGLADAVADGEQALPAAITFARGLAARQDRLRRTRDLPVRLADAHRWFAARRAGLAPVQQQGPAARTILDCIEAGVTQSVEEATRVAAQGTRTLTASREFQALRHLFFAERQAARVAEVTAEERLRIRTVRLVGPDEQGWATLLASRGVEMSGQAPELLLVTCADQPVLDELHRLEASLDAHVPIATTGDYHTWRQWRSAFPARSVLGLRLAGERLVQLVREPEAPPVVLDAVAALIRRLGKVCVPCSPAPGFIVERLLAVAAGCGGPHAPAGIRAMAREGRELLAQGIAVRASDIDVAMVVGAGFPDIRGGPMYADEQAGN